MGFRLCEVGHSGFSWDIYMYNVHGTGLGFKWRQGLRCTGVGV